MKNFDTRTYNVSDFIEWSGSKLLDLSPQFQRRSVWTEKAKSFLVDTVIRGKPIPKIIITQTLSKNRNIRTVVDGQQRIRAILGFYNGDFSISRAHNRDLAGMKYDELPQEVKDDFLKYEIGVDLIFDQQFEDILDIFARLNTYSVKLNSQELLNAKYLGYFKQSAYSCGYKYVRYWLESQVLSEKEVTRMSEAELASDLLTMLVGGIQSKKAIPNFYKKYEDNDDGLGEAISKFDAVMSYIGAAYEAASLKETNFSRIHLFYSLFGAIAHGLYGLSGMDEVPRPHLTPESIGRIRMRLDEISARYDEITSGEGPITDEAYANFIEASRRATTDLTTRKLRTCFICQNLIQVLQD
jgi:Protein of unknown function DUF262